LDGVRWQAHAERFLADDSARRWQEAGARAAPYPGKGDFRPDRYAAELALRYLEWRRPRFVFLGLGEPDEYAHRGDYSGYVASLRATDAVIGRLFETLDRMAARGASTTVFVTTDHGRARDHRFHGRIFPERALLHQAADDAPLSGAPIDELLADVPEEYAAKR